MLISRWDYMQSWKFQICPEVQLCSSLWELRSNSCQVEVQFSGAVFHVFKVKQGIVSNSVKVLVVFVACR